MDNIPDKLYTARSGTAPGMRRLINDPMAVAGWEKIASDWDNTEAGSRFNPTTPRYLNALKFFEAMVA